MLDGLISVNSDGVDLYTDTHGVKERYEMSYMRGVLA